MALKIELKPGERIILGQAVVTNGDTRTRLVVEGEVPILREKDILSAKDANTSAKRIYLAVQLMYLSQDPTKIQNEYMTLVKEFLSAVPSSFPIIEQMNNDILTGSAYKALKAAKKLIAYEEELLNHAQRNASLCESSTNHSGAA
jgi:flagellar biosynthesis repressor protein FlbT